MGRKKITKGKYVMKKKIEQNKSLKYSLFFGFYIIFFIVLFIMYQNYGKKVDEIKKQEEKITIYDIVRDSIDKYYHDKYEYQVFLNNEMIMKNVVSNPNNESHQYQYYFDLYNINKLIKNSKLEKEEENTYYFKLNNQELDSIFNTTSEKIDNDIILYTNDNKLIKVVYDLSNYYQEDLKIEINYIKGDNNENSSS